MPGWAEKTSAAAKTDQGRDLMRFTGLAAAAAMMAMGAAVSAQAATLDDVRDRGHVVCGVNTGLAGFASPNEDGDWEGFDVDYCRAVAAAIFNDPAAVRFRALTSQERFTALQSAEIDVLSRNTTYTFTRDVSVGVDFIGTNYYDGQGFLIPRSLEVESAHELDGARVCVQTGTTTELNLADFFRANDMSFDSVVIQTAEEARRQYLAEACDAYTTDISGLAAVRATMPDPSQHLILPEVISKEPLGPVVRQGDHQWADLNRWVLNAMITAEELGVTSANVDEMRETSQNPNVRRLLGSEGDLGTALGLEAGWASQVISHVGNYGESFDRNIGENSPLGLERGLNAQWTDGGILYAPPLR